MDLWCFDHYHHHCYHHSWHHLHQRLLGTSCLLGKSIIVELYPFLYQASPEQTMATITNQMSIATL